MSKSLTKNAICESVAATNGCTQKQAVDVVETLIELIKRSLEAGNDVLISGFGKFSVRQKNERRGGTLRRTSQ